MLIVKMPCKENDPNKKISEPYMNPHSAQRNDEIRASEHNPSLEKNIVVLCSFASFDVKLSSKDSNFPVLISNRKRRLFFVTDLSLRTYSFS